MINPKVWIKVRVLDQDGRILGESALTKQEQYVNSVTLKQPITKTQKVVLKIMAYEPDTYMSVVLH